MRNWDEIEKTLQEDPDHEAMLAKAKAEVAAEEEAYFRALAARRRNLWYGGQLLPYLYRQKGAP